jgi:hypothetical protein
MQLPLTTIVGKSCGTNHMDQLDQYLGIMCGDQLSTNYVMNCATYTQEASGLCCDPEQIHTDFLCLWTCRSLSVHHGYSYRHLVGMCCIKNWSKYSSIVYKSSRFPRLLLVCFRIQRITYFSKWLQWALVKIFYFAIEGLYKNKPHYPFFSDIYHHTEVTERIMFSRKLICYCYL